MPQYELMYLLGSHVADDEVPKISASILKFAEDNGAKEVKETQLGKKKLAYPIGKTRNGHYIVVNFTMDAKNINTYDAKIRTLNTNVIRYIMINTDEHLDRLAKDKIVQSKIVRRIPVEETPVAEKAATPMPKKQKEAVKLEEIDEKALEAKIDAALSEDVTK
jgi:small subunit ribosomal protein S6